MKGDHKPVRVTPTHAGPDSKGIVSILGWDLEGMVAFYLVGGALVGMLTVFALSGRPLGTRFATGAVPLLLSILWVKIFVHNRPPSYQRDVLEGMVRGKDFNLRPQQWCRKTHPKNVLLAREAGRMEERG